MSERDDLFEVIDTDLVDDAEANRIIDAFELMILRRTAGKARDIPAADCFSQPEGCRGYKDVADFIDPDHVGRVGTTAIIKAPRS